MSVIEYEIKDPKKQRDFYRDLCEVKDIKIDQLQQENKQLKEELKYTVPIVEHNKIVSEKLNENKQLKEENERLKEIENKLIFIKNRKKQGMTQENINMCAINFVNSYLKELEEGKK